MINLSASGLSPTEAYIYETMLTKKEWLPADLSKTTKESRTNIYKILDKLTSLALVEKYKKDKKLHYRANNPNRLLQLAYEKKQAFSQHELELEAASQELIKQYIKNNEQPGVRFFVGKDQIKAIYQDQVEENQEILFVLSPKAIDYYGYGEMHNLRMLAVNAKLPRKAIVPDNRKATKNYKETDRKYLLTRTWLDKSDYTAPLEWGVYGDKTYFIAFGEEALGLIIESKAMADGMKQIFNLIDRLQRSSPSYDKLPIIASVQK
jgi:sugar-specific transcriptional regulator TrmB